MPLKMTEGVYKKYAINNFVLFKLKDEWIECRIKEIIPSDKKDSRNLSLFLIKYNYMHSEIVPDSNVYPSSIENIKKFRFSYKDSEVLIPVFLLNFLREDRMKIKNNLNVSLPSKYSIKKILNDFGSFLLKNKSSISEDEQEEVIKGFSHLFNSTIDKYLLYESEYEQFEKISTEYKDKDLSDVYGVEHLVRLIVMLNMRNKNIDDVINELLIYLCDFLDLFYRKYFIERVYVPN